MSTVVSRVTLEPIGRRAFWLSGATALVTAAAAGLSLAFPGVFRDPAVTVGNARGTALVMVVAAALLLTTGMVLAARDSLVGRVLWLSALGYILYNAVLFCFALAFNSFFLLYVATLGLSLWALVDVLRQVRTAQFAGRLAQRAPVRVAALYMALVALLFAFTWLRDIIPGLIDNRSPDSFAGTVMLTNPVHVLDLSLTIPLLLVGAAGLWRRRDWGFVAAAVLLAMITLEAAGVAVDQWFGHRADPGQSLGAVPMMAGLFAVSLLVTAVFLRGAGRPDRRD